VRDLHLDDQTRQLLRAREQLEIWVDPVRYFSDRPAKLTPELALGFLQDMVLELLGRYLNSYVPKAGRPQDALNERRPFLRVLTATLGSPPSLGPTDGVPEEHYPAILAELYRYLVDAAKRHAKPGSEAEILLERIERPHADARVQRLVEGLRKEGEGALAPHVTALLLYGSLADNTPSGFSDVDSLLVVRDGSILDGGLLRDLAEDLRPSLKLMIQFDPLQDHGHLIVPEGALSFYSQGILPLAIVRQAELIHPTAAKLAVRERTPGMEGRHRFWRILQRFRRVAADPDARPANLQEAKVLLSQFMVLPALHLGENKKFLSKRDTFAEARKGFSDAEWAVMEEVSSIRAKWPRPGASGLGLYLSLHSNPWAGQSSYWRSWPFRTKIPPEIGQPLYERMLELAERLWERSG
jgi:hypothetical protein